MTNREILNRIKKCFTNFKWPGGYEELALTNRDAFESLISDLLRDAEEEEKRASIEGLLKSWSKIAMISTYGKDALCPCCHRSCLEMTNKQKLEMAKPLTPSPIKEDEFKLDSFKSTPLKFELHLGEPIDDAKFVFKAFPKVVNLSEKNNGGIKRRLEDKPVVYFDEPYTILKWGDFTTIVECDPEDKFDRATGLGIALYRYYRQHKDYKKAYQKLNYALKFEELALCAVLQFCGYNSYKVEALTKKLKKFNEGSWNELDI